MTESCRVSICEVGLRDGLQNEAAFVPTTDKIELARMLADAGLNRVELTSFVSPKWIPQLSDHARVAGEVERRPGVRFSALVPNRFGLDGAVAAGLEEIAIFLSASESHTKKNINKTIRQALDVLGDVAKTAIEHGMRVRGYVSVAFGCPYEGKVDPRRVLEILQEVLAMGVYEVSLGDTIGAANPRLVQDVLQIISRAVPPDRLALHMHDTRGMALANVLTGLNHGITTIDSAFGGLGGCPYAPGASGNLATEDLVYMLDGMGYETNVSLDRLVEASVRAGRLVGRNLPSKVLRAELADRAKAVSRSKPVC